jgi:CO dehydrogenase nickel-insertion accessory protein CooC1
MNILIVGKSGYGKSNLSDLIRNAIFKADENCKITVDDHDRDSKVFGGGENEYTINVRREMKQEDYENADIVVEINSKAFIDRFNEIY